MAERLRTHAPTSPNRRVRQAGDGYFFVGEVAVMLGIKSDVDYRQLRQLFEVVRSQSGATVPAKSGGWSRYTLTDIAGLQELLKLCGGRAALTDGRRLRVGCVKRACEALREQGFQNPLLDVPLVRHGDSVYAHIGGSLFDPVDGQTVLTGALELVTSFVGETDAALSERLQSEASRTQRRPPRHRTDGPTLIESGARLRP